SRQLFRLLRQRRQLATHDAVGEAVGRLPARRAQAQRPPAAGSRLLEVRHAVRVVRLFVNVPVWRHDDWRLPPLPAPKPLMPGLPFHAVVDEDRVPGLQFERPANEPPLFGDKILHQRRRALASLLVVESPHQYAQQNQAAAHRRLHRQHCSGPEQETYRRRDHQRAQRHGRAPEVSLRETSVGSGGDGQRTRRNTGIEEI
ncbi:unnamed protein product, partial [Prorocentrum cordatum]